MTLLTKLESPAERQWYAVQTFLQGRSHSTLELNIKSRLQHRQASAVTNIVSGLPVADSALAQKTLEDTYLFDILDLDLDAQGHDIETGLIRNIPRFLLELGAGFAFVGQFRLVGVAEYQLLRDLPDALGRNLPSIAEIEAGLAGELNTGSAVE